MSPRLSRRQRRMCPGARGDRPTALPGHAPSIGRPCACGSTRACQAECLLLTTDERAAMWPDDYPVAVRRKCPKCGSRRVRRSRRSDAQRAESPDAELYRCRKCDIRFVLLDQDRPAADLSRPASPRPAQDAAAPQLDAQPPPPTVGRSDRRSEGREGLSNTQYVLVFILSGILTSLLIAIFGRG